MGIRKSSKLSCGAVSCDFEKYIIIITRHLIHHHCLPPRLYKVDIKFLDWEGFLVILSSVSSDSHERCFLELKAEGTSDVSHGIAKGLAVRPCHVLFQFLDKHHSLIGVSCLQLLKNRVE